MGIKESVLIFLTSLILIAGCATSKGSSHEDDRRYSSQFKCPKGAFLLVNMGKESEWIKRLKSCYDKSSRDYLESMLLKKFRSLERDIKRCLGKGVKPPHSIYGEVQIQGRIDREGKVIAASTFFSSLGEREVERCIEERFLGIKGIEGVDNNEVSFLFPIIFLSDKTPPETINGIIYKYR